MTDILAAATRDQQLSSQSPQNTTANRSTQTEDLQPPTDSQMYSEAEETQQSPDSATDPSMIEQSCAFMRKLPAEMRVVVYHLVLFPYPFEYIEVTSTGYSTNGGLLLTCKEIRREAYDIFYLKNAFEHVVINYDSRPLLKFRDSASDEASLEVALEDPRTPCWKTLLVWVENVHARRCETAYPPPEEVREIGIAEMDYFILGTMFETAEHLGAQPWEFVKPLVEMHRPTLITIDQGWEIN